MGGSETSADLKNMLRDRGLRLTAPRMVVLQVLREGQRHMTAEEIYAAVMERAPTINMVTVYRTLESFEAHGLAVSVELGDKLTRWEWVGDAHHHLICVCCGAVVQLDDAPFQHLIGELARTHGVRADARHLALRGLCAYCAAAAS